MTATISPPPGAVARADPAIRTLDYAKALEFYLALPTDQFDRIVFADNSASDLRGLFDVAVRSCADKEVEFLSFPANDHPPGFGKAYGEFRLLDIALTESEVIGERDRVWKTTGRLRCLNLAILDRRLPGEIDLACDLHNVPFVGSGQLLGGQMMDLRLFAFRKPFYDKVFRGRWKAAVPVFDAHVIYTMVQRSRTLGQVQPRFPRQPVIDGRSGRTERSYLGTAQRAKDTLRGALRVVAPWLWL